MKFYHLSFVRYNSWITYFHMLFLADEFLVALWNALVSLSVCRCVLSSICLLFHYSVYGYISFPIFLLVAVFFPSVSKFNYFLRSWLSLLFFYFAVDSGHIYRTAKCSRVYFCYWKTSSVELYLYRERYWILFPALTCLAYFGKDTCFLSFRLSVLTGAPKDDTVTSVRMGHRSCH